MTPESQRPPDSGTLPRSIIESTLATAISRQVARASDRVAVRAAGREITYAELDARSDRLARALVARLGQGAEPVPFLTAHDPCATVALLGILKAGKLVVPLDPLQPAAVHRSIITQCGASVIVASEARRDEARVLGGDVVELDASGHCEAASEEVALPGCGPQDLAVILYTSGTSGEPKGVYSSNRCELHSMWTMVDRMAFGPTDNVGVVMPLSYRFALAFTMATLITGGTVAFYDLRTDGFPGLPAWLAGEQVSVLPLVPAILRALAGGGARSFPAVRSTMISGERAERSDVELAHAIFGSDVQVVHALASTEAQLIAMHDLPPGVDVPSSVPVGRPAPDKRVEVVDEEGHALPPGHVGEVTVSSEYLTEGYWRRPDLTDMVFTDRTSDGERCYRTGDLGLLDDDGVLVLVGRGDSQVKVRGHRVELAEIESALAGLDAVESAVVTTQGTEGGTSLAAHVVLADGRGHVTPQILRSSLEELLPDYAVPSVLVVLRELPLLPNGKVDRRALPVVDLRSPRAPAAASVDEASRDPVEKELVRLWEAVLQVAPIGLDDDFFALSDHSLQAAEIVVAIEDSLGVALPVSALIGAKTPRALAELVRAAQAQPSDVTPGLVTISARPEGPRLLLCPDLSGSPFRFQPMAEALGTDVHLLGFESPLFVDGRAEVRTIADLAAHNIEQAVAADPDGPYHLMGWSVGGFVAFEMARQLRRTGRAVGAVIVLDAGPHMISRAYRPLSEARRRSRRPPRPLSLSDEGGPSADGGMRRAIEAALPAPVVDRLVWRRDLRRDGRIRADRRLPFVWHVNWKAAQTYRFARYEGDVDFITSKRPAAKDLTSGLAPHVGGALRIHHVVGEHERLVFEPMVVGVADSVREALGVQGRG